MNGLYVVIGNPPFSIAFRSVHMAHWRPMPPAQKHYWVKIPRPDGMRYFVRFVQHYPTVRWTMNRLYQEAYCFAAADDAQRVADVLRSHGVDASVGYKAVAAPPSVPSRRLPPEHLRPWVDRILQVGAALGKVDRERIDAGYRALAQEHHPDRGGRVGDMQFVNEARAWLRGHSYDDVEVPF